MYGPLVVCFLKAYIGEFRIRYISVAKAMRNVFSKETLLPTTATTYSISGILNVHGLLSKPDVLLKKKIGQLLFKEENYAKIEHFWSIKMKSAQMLRVGDMYLCTVNYLHRYSHNSFFAPNFQ